MPVLPITEHAARWDLEDAIAKAAQKDVPITMAMIDAYVELVAGDIETTANEAREQGYDAGYAKGQADADAELRKRIKRLERMLAAAKGAS